MRFGPVAVLLFFLCIGPLAAQDREQVVRLLHPRPRTLWSRWVEGFEAMRLEVRFSKSEILEFYLDQVPYGSQRRGIRQAARHVVNGAARHGGRD